MDKEVGEAYHEMIRFEKEVDCPICKVSSMQVKTNGGGYYRCKGRCRKTFFIAIEKGLKGDK